MALKKQHFAEGEIAIFDEACIYNRRQYWELRMRLPKENKYARKSLRTRSEATAIETGKAAYLEIYANLQHCYKPANATVTVFTSGLRPWLHKSDVAIVTIKPGFTDPPRTAEFKKGLSWVKPNAVAPKIERAINERPNEVYVPLSWCFSNGVHQNHACLCL